MRCWIFLSFFLAVSPHLFAATSALPRPDDIFTVGFYPAHSQSPEYFNEKSFLKTYPKLFPANVNIAVGAKRYFQSGVIVTKDKGVLFWNTCSDLYISIMTKEGQQYFATKSEVSIR